MRLITRLMLLAGVAIALTGCPRPKYPACDKDEHCKEGEFCVDKRCQQCRTTKDCPEGKRCNAGRCDPIPGYCGADADCPGGRVCKDHRCAPCQADGDCGDGRCREGRCLAPGQCASDEDCKGNEECQNGVCVAPPPETEQPTGAQVCTPQAVYFGFDQSVLSEEATARLKQAAECIRRVTGRRLRVEGHTDPRGTEEYNLALGDRRARAVLRYLRRLGIDASRLRPVSKGELDATGSDPASWARDRKVVFIWE